MLNRTPPAGLHDLFSEAERYCARRGITMKTLAYEALNNTGWFEKRLAGRAYLSSSVEKLRDYMRENPNRRSQDISLRRNRNNRSTDDRASA